MIGARMADTGNDTAADRRNRATEWLAYLTLAPLILCLAGLGLLPEYGARDLAQRIALDWGAALLAFTGAVHWGLALGGRLPGDGAHAAAALAPALAGAVAAVAGGQRGLALLVVGFGVFWLYEHRRLGAQLPAAYLSLRRHLTIATCILLALIMFASDAAGLS
jgi:hypothetical protein